MLAEQLRGLMPDATYSSPEAKALETAEIIAESLDLGVTVIADLREHDRTGVRFFARPGEFEANVLGLFAAPDELVFGHESAAAALGRFREAIGQVLSHEDRQPLVVTHGTVMSLYLEEIAGLRAATVWRELSMPCFVVLPHTSSGEASIEHLLP